MGTTLKSQFVARIFQGSELSDSRCLHPKTFLPNSLRERIQYPLRIYLPTLREYCRPFFGGKLGQLFGRFFPSKMMASMWDMAKTSNQNMDSCPSQVAILH